jgi:O-antigen/teichoic acid export membrane protein
LKPILKKIVQSLTLLRAVQLAQLGRQGGVFVSSILLAKSAWGTVNVGIYETLMFLGGTARFFWMNALLQGMLSYAPRMRENERNSFFVNAFYLLFLLNILTFGLTFWARSWILMVLANHSDLAYFHIFSFYLLLNLPAFLLETLFQLQGRAWALLGFSWASHGAQIGFIGLLILGGGHFSTLFDGLVVIAALRFGWLLIEIIKLKKFDINFSLMKSFFIFCFPLIGYALLNGLATNFDAILVNWFYGGDKSVFAVFRYGAREFPLVLSLCVGLSNHFVPIFAKNIAESLPTFGEAKGFSLPSGGLGGDNTGGVSNFDFSELKTRSRRLWWLLFPATMLMLLSSDWLYLHIFNINFVASSPIFKIYLLLIFARTLFPQTILLALGDNRAVFLISIIENLSNILLSIALIFPFGLSGVAFGTVIAFFIEKICIAFYIWKKYKINIHQYMDLKTYLIFSLLLLLTFFYFF